MNTTVSKYISFRVRGLPAGPFGETYLIVAIMSNSDYSKSWESFLISKRFQPSLHKSACSYEIGVDLDKSFLIDEGFLEEEAKQQAEIYLEDALEEVIGKSSQAPSYQYKPELIPMRTSPLHSLWFRGELQDEIQDIAKSTECSELKSYLEALVKSSFTRRPG